VVLTKVELNQVVDQMMSNPKIEACIACELQCDEATERHRLDSRVLKADWREHADFWRCTITTQPTSGAAAAQIDLHDNGTVRTTVFLPCKLTISREEGFLCLSL
jgi:hypothetical protein